MFWYIFLNGLKLWLDYNTLEQRICDITNRKRGPERNLASEVSSEAICRLTDSLVILSFCVRFLLDREDIFSLWLSLWICKIVTHRTLNFTLQEHDGMYILRKLLDINSFLVYTSEIRHFINVMYYAYRYIENIFYKCFWAEYMHNFAINIKI